MRGEGFIILPYTNLKNIKFKFAEKLSPFCFFCEKNSACTFYRQTHYLLLAIFFFQKIVSILEKTCFLYSDFY